MADMNGEAAFLASMGGEAAYDPTASYQQPEPDEDEQEEDEEEDYDPSSFMPTDLSQQATSATLQPASSVTVTATADASQITLQPPSRSASRLSNQSAQKPQTIGGFIEEDDDEDEEEHGNAAVQSGANGMLALAGPNTPSQASLPSLVGTPSQANVQVYNAPKDLGTPDVVPNGAAETLPIASALLPSQSAAPSTEEKSAVETVTTPLPRSTTALPSAQTLLPKPRLPQDRIGQLEDRIKDDPKGDVDAWLDLIAHYRSKERLDDARKVYERFFDVFPTSAEQWVAYAGMELEQDDLQRLETIFHQSLMKNLNVQLWTIYLDHIRRRNNIMTDTTGTARQMVSSVYDFVLNTIGIDKDSGKIWQDYIDFIKSGPGTPGGSGWQDAQKMDLLRKAYQRAICVPMQATSTLWKEYDSFEMGLNKTTGRKFLQEKSPAYMTARSSYTALQNITKDLQRTTQPSLPPAPGCEGEENFRQQIEIWQRWIEWEKEDPLVLKEEDVKAYRDRVMYAYKQAIMALRFWPEIWCNAADFCFENGLDTEGSDFLVQGAAANPESCLLAFKRADRLEQTLPVEEGEESLKRRGDAVKEPYSNVLNALYALIDKAREREPRSIAQIKEYFASLPPQSQEPTPEPKEEDDEEEEQTNAPRLSARQAEEKMQTDAVQQGTKAQIALLSRMLSFVWIALMRAMRRIQGKGKPDAPIGGLRNVFAEARKRGRITSDVYVATALIEHHCYKDPAATKIFERGMKLFPEDELFTLEYLKHLIAINDVTNARAVFETTVSRLTAKPDGALKARPLYLYFHAYESHFGELAQITKLEKRMRDLYPSDPSLTLFGHRFKMQSFDPCAVRPIISPKTQMRPRLLLPFPPPTTTVGAIGGMAAMPSIESLPVPPPPIQNLTSATQGYTSSPKRPLDLSNANGESDSEAPVRKLLRGESPLKGAAGRRQQQRQRAEGYGSGSGNALTSTMAGGIAGGAGMATGPKPLPREITMLLAVIPNARDYREVRFDAERMVALLRSVDLGRANVGAAGGGGAGAYGGYGYGR